MSEQPLPLMEEEDERRERDEQIVNWFERSQHILNAYQSHQETPKELRMSQRCMQFALGFHLVAGADSLSGLARECGVSKWTAGKCVNHFIEQLGLEPLPGQRRAAARENMSRARKRQLS